MTFEYADYKKLKENGNIKHVKINGTRLVLTIETYDPITGHSITRNESVDMDQINILENKIKTDIIQLNKELLYGKAVIEGLSEIKGDFIAARISIE